MTYPLFDVIKAMWRFTLFKLEKSTVESNHPYWGGGVLKKFFKVFVNGDVSLATDFCSHALKNLNFYLNTSYFKVSLLIY